MKRLSYKYILHFSHISVVAKHSSKNGEHHYKITKLHFSITFKAEEESTTHGTVLRALKYTLPLYHPQIQFYNVC